MTDYTNIIYAFITLVFLSLITAYIIIAGMKYLARKRKADLFFQKYFNEDRIYRIEEVSRYFNLEKEKMLSILKTLESSNMFPSLRKNKVSMEKDYYSKYEMKILTNLLAKKNKLIL